MKIGNREVIETDLLRVHDWVPKYKWFPWIFYKKVEAHWVFIDEKYIWIDKQKYQELCKSLDEKEQV